VLKRLSFIAKDKKLLIQMAKDASRKLSKSLPKLEREIAELEQERRKLQAQIDNIVGHMANTPKEMANASLYDKLSELEKSVAHIESEKEQAKTQRKETTKANINTEALFKFLQFINTELETMPPQQKRDVLRLILKSVTILSPHRVRLDYFSGGGTETSMGLEKKSNRGEIREDSTRTAGSYVFQRFGNSGKTYELFLLPDTIRLHDLPDIHNPAFLKSKYIIEGLSMQQIAGLAGTTKASVQRALKRHQILYVK
jgi:regulator of replication initiation timing